MLLGSGWFQVFCDCTFLEYFPQFLSLLVPISFFKLYRIDAARTYGQSVFIYFDEESKSPLTYIFKNLTIDFSDIENSHSKTIS